MTNVKTAVARVRRGSLPRPANACLLFALGAMLALPACATESPTVDGRCRDGKCDDLDKPDDEVDDTPCDGVMVDASGRSNRKVAGRLNDPVAQLAFRDGENCPTSYQDIIAKLRKNDTEGCDENTEGAGMTARVISETAQSLGMPTSYRAVVTRKCNSRPTHGMIFSLFGVRAGAASLPSNVEIMAFDESAGVFNYYETDGREIKWFGNSKDLLKGSPDGQTRRCAKCHAEGGMIMKELDTPWSHWEGHMDTPGAKELVDSNKALLGTKSSGIELEGVVKAANRQWNDTRIAHAREKLTAKEILKPIFCTQEINLDNGADFFSPSDGKKGTCSNDKTVTCNEDVDCGDGNSCSTGSLLSSVPSDAFLDKKLKGFGSISVSHDDYQALLAARGSRVDGMPGGIVDTVFDFIFPEKAAITMDYADKLVAAGIVDEEFLKDVAMVDFTRPIFSADRCSLIEFAPNLTGEDLTAEKIRNGFIANLGNPAAGSPALELLANLGNEGGQQTKVDAFFTTCQGLDQSQAMNNFYDFVSQMRKEAAAMDVMEFPQTAPTDNNPNTPGLRLDPTTCELTSDFVSVADTSNLPEPDPTEPDPDPAGGDDCGFNTKAAQDGPGTAGACDCVSAMCDADPFCCNTRWDNICAEAAQASPDCQ